MASRVARNPIQIPKSVQVQIDKRLITVKGPKGQLSHVVHRDVNIDSSDEVLKFSPANQRIKQHSALAGTTRALINNNVIGVSEGFVRELEVKGTGYRVNVKGKSLELSLGFSHTVVFDIPEGVTIECPTQDSIVVRGCCKQQVGQVAANIRAYRQPDCYKGKGVRYKGEKIILKETKKK